MLIVSGGESISIQSRTILKQGNHSISKGNHLIPKGNHLISKGNHSIPKGNHSIPKGNHSIPKSCSKSDGVKMRSVLDVPDTHIFEKKRQYYLNKAKRIAKSI